MKYDTNENLIEIAGSKVESKEERKDLEVSRRVDETKNKRQNYYSCNISNKSDNETDGVQILSVILIATFVVITIVLMSKMITDKAKTIQDAVMSLGVI